MTATDTIEFRVIGEQRDDCGHLLLMGDDGHYYDYAVCRDEVIQIEPDDSWRFDPVRDEDATVHFSATSIPGDR